ncbi:hypothetical protein [Vampirovibrio sp.]
MNESILSEANVNVLETTMPAYGCCRISTVRKYPVVITGFE